MPAQWNDQHRMMHVAIKGYDVRPAEQPKANLVFLLDVSGSMNQPDKLPLLQSAFRLLVNKLRPDDTVSIVTYAGDAGTVLEPTKVSEKEKILQAIDTLTPGGSTAGEAGIKEAYRLAEKSFVKDGVNRVMLATDGDFNVGQTDDDDLKRIIEEKRKSGVFLSVFGFGRGNLNDQMMQTIAQNGNGTAAYIDTLQEAEKVLVEDASSTLFPIAKDVKIQVEFNPAQVGAYRLIGYENRVLAKEDFNDDQKDAGEMGAGHTVTALYEIIPAGVETNLLGSVDPLKYQKGQSAPAAKGDSKEWLHIKLRYKEPQGMKSQLLEKPVQGPAKSLDSASENFRWAASVAEFGMLLRQSEFKGEATYAHCYQLAQSASAKESDTHGYRREFLQMIDTAMKLGKPDLDANKN